MQSPPILVINLEHVLHIMDIEPEEQCDTLHRKIMRLWITVPFIAKQYAGHSDSYSEYEEAEQMLKLIKISNHTMV
jgi:hypothetical protein